MRPLKTCQKHTLILESNRLEVVFERLRCKVTVNFIQYFLVRSAVRCLLHLCHLLLLQPPRPTRKNIFFLLSREGEEIKHHTAREQKKE